MRYIYLDNFRGFKQTVIPINQITFLVGENSTGKSSFLKLISIITNNVFIWDPSHAFDQAIGQSTFNDLVSINSSDRNYFDIGYFEDGTDDERQIILYRFHEQGNMPVTEWVIAAHNGYVAQAVKNAEGVHEIRSLKEHPLLFDGDATALFARLLQMAQDHKPEFRKVPKEMSASAPVTYLLSFAVPEKVRNKFGPTRTRPFSNNPVVSIAPIRTAPKQFYGGARAVYSEDGQHTPYVLRQALQNRSSQFIEYLRSFGEASGLFDTIVTHSFGSDPRSPFELLVKFHNVELSIDNVGYGVSQVLPLIVEFLTSRNGTFFLVQQPEVHLHPRAQAALGGLMYALAKAKNYTYFIETHSDFLIDRYRLAKRSDPDKINMRSQVIFFKRGELGNIAYSIPIDSNGRFSDKQPRDFREFFIREEMKLLEI